MPPKKSKEEQKLAGKLKLEAFKRQRAEAKAAKASAGDVAISDASNATESSEAKGDADAASKADARAPDAPPPRVTDPPAPVMEARAASTLTAATAAPFADVAPRSPPEEKIAAPLADVASSSVARAEPSPPLDGSVFQSLPGSSPGSPSTSFGDLGAEPRTAPDALRTHVGEAREAHLVTSLDEETENAVSRVASLERAAAEARSDAASARADLAASRRAGADAAAARARAEGERDAALRRAASAESAARSAESAARSRLAALETEAETRAAASASATRAAESAEARVVTLTTAMGALETELEAERGARVRLENEYLVSKNEKAASDAARDAASSSARDAETALTAKALAAENRARAAEDDQLRAEEDAAAARAELDAARRELAEVLQVSRREESVNDTKHASSPREETTRGDETSDETRFETRFEEERFALASEIRALTRKLDAARADAAEAREAKARAEAKAETRDAARDAETAAAAAAAAHTAAALEAEKDAVREAKARARDAETAVAELRAAAAANANANVVSESAESATGRDFNLQEGVSLEESERSIERTNRSNHSDSKPARETPVNGNEPSGLLVGANPNPDGNGATVQTTVQTLTLERDAYLERLNAKIRSSNETQDLLLRELDARDGELETLDARLAAAIAGNAALNEKLDAALAMARAERVRVERLAEMLEEQAAWGSQTARESIPAGTTNAIEERANGEHEHERDDERNERTERDERSADGGAAAPATPARDAHELKKNTVAVAESPAAKLAAEILAGSELGRAYHPLLASIEARLLRLRNEKLPDARAGA